jgi:hypothetical protein
LVSTATIDVGSGRSDILHTATLTGLVWGTTYHYRAVATNAGGLSYGADQTFTFPLPPLSISRSGTNVIVSWPGWPDTSTNCVLQQIADLASGTWTNVLQIPDPHVTNGSARIDPEFPGRPAGGFFRLKK